MVSAIEIRRNKGTCGVVSDRGLQSEKENGRRIHRALVGRLTTRGFGRVEIARLIKDVFNIRRDEKNISVRSLNRALSILGWGEDVMDETMYSLMLSILESHQDIENGG